MKKTLFSTLAALALCALLFTACGGSVSEAPAADPAEKTPAPEASGTPEADDRLSADVEHVTHPGLIPEGGDAPLPAEPDPPAAEPDPPAAEPDPPVTEPDPPAAEPDSPAAEPDPPAATADAVEPSSARLGETPDAGREYLDKLIFLGDSTTYGIGYYYDRGFSEDLVPPSQVWTPASGTLTLSYYATSTIVYPETGEELFIRDAVERAKPEYLVITLGVNGISFMDEEWFVRDYTGLVESVKEASPETKIILNSIYPVATSYQYQKDINNGKIRAANGWIERITADTGARFLYSHEAVVGADGSLPEASSNGDGLHLTGESFAKVMRYIRTHEYR